MGWWVGVHGCVCEWAGRWVGMRGAVCTGHRIEGQRVPDELRDGGWKMLIFAANRLLLPISGRTLTHAAPLHLAVCCWC